MIKTIENDRIILRALRSSDCDDIFAMQSDPLMCEHSDSLPESERSGSMEYIERMNLGIAEGKWILWGIEEKASQKVVGTICIWNFSADRKIAELGYGIVPSARGKGIMTQALLDICQYCSEILGMSALDAYTEEHNTKSIHLLKRLGFRRTGMETDHGFYQNRDFNMVIFRTDFEKN